MELSYAIDNVQLNLTYCTFALSPSAIRFSRNPLPKQYTKSTILAVYGSAISHLIIHEKDQRYLAHFTQPCLSPLTVTHD